ncbi:Mitogen-activated protein kinase adapter protein MST50 [Sporothrix epigloea]|uniref:Mitogen-activated protein kinase adapter protein MST50 n=1 Tax=Sporothrix epigloea TaxID=1892477 RepID=A0ABP0D9B3_9PEZI
MNYQQGTSYAESDTEDEYERVLRHGSLADVNSSELPVTGADFSSEQTPTIYAYHSSADRLPETLITDWTAEECADFIASIGLQQYAERFIENEIVGEALVALLHEDLKLIGVASVGHRLTILKSVYEVKKAQEVPIESDHYVPLTAETEAQATFATLKDIKHLVEQLRLRDERMSLFEQDCRRLTEDFRRLREDVLPALRLVKDAQQPLPQVNSGANSNINDQIYPYEAMASPPVATPLSASHSINIKRQYSNRKIVATGSTPKTTSPTHLQTSHDRMLAEQSLDSAKAAERAMLSSQHLAAANGINQTVTSPSYPSTTMPSPTSPSTFMNGPTLASRSYRSDQPPSSGRSTFVENDHSYGTSSRDKHLGAPRRAQTNAGDTPGSNATVEIFKSFRVGMDDPCYKVLPAALRRYQITGPPDQYALYIVYGDQERCLALNEKPLIIFKQLDKEGKKPMFMLRKTANADVDLPFDVPGSAGLNAAARGVSTGYDPPGGII